MLQLPHQVKILLWRLPVLIWQFMPVQGHQAVSLETGSSCCKNCRSHHMYNRMNSTTAMLHSLVLTTTWSTRLTKTTIMMQLMATRVPSHVMAQQWNKQIHVPFINLPVCCVVIPPTSLPLMDVIVSFGSINYQVSTMVPSSDAQMSILYKPLLTSTCNAFHRLTVKFIDGMIKLMSLLLFVTAVSPTTPYWDLIVSKWWYTDNSLLKLALKYRIATVFNCCRSSMIPFVFFVM